MKGCFSLPVGTPNPGSEYQVQLSEDDLSVIIEYEEEQQRLGNFERIFPLYSNANYYRQFFEHLRPSNELLVKYLKAAYSN